MPGRRRAAPSNRARAGTAAVAIWWVRRDLRLHGNPALAQARAGGRHVIPLFVVDPSLLASRYASPRRLAFLFAGLRSLDNGLRARGGRLIVRRGRPEEVLAQLVRETGAQAIVAQDDVSPYARSRDARVAARLPLQLVDGLTVLPLGAVLKKDGTPYTVFTPFRRAWELVYAEGRPAVLGAPRHVKTPHGAGTMAIPFAAGDFEEFPAGEAHARKRLGAFIAGHGAPVYRYAAQRDRVDLDGTSRLSPYLRFGMISARQAMVAAMQALRMAPDAASRQSVHTWIGELIWREFYISVLHHFPDVLRLEFRAGTRGIRWERDGAALAAWREGRTGFPVVDAAMRQLAQTGWMPNRARMIVASFLVKDLLIDWRLGECHFMRHLLDGDPASNNGGWQWSAGVGTDAAPYFRVLNPTIQGRKADPYGNFVRRWVPELAHVPGPHIHEPWTMSVEMQRDAECVVGEDYPAPLVDHKQARRRALSRYGELRP